MLMLLLPLFIMVFKSQLIFNASLLLNYTLPLNSGESVLQIENGYNSNLYAIILQGNSTFRVVEFSSSTYSPLDYSPYFSAALYDK